MLWTDDQVLDDLQIAPIMDGRLVAPLDRFYEVAPKMATVVRRVDADPRLAEFWAKRFPFDEGWE